MAERIAYEIAFEGAGQAISQVLGVQSALESLNGTGMGNVTRGILAATSAVNQFKNAVKGIAKVQTPFTSRGTYSAIDLGLVPNIDLNTVSLESFAKNIGELRAMRERTRKFNRGLLQNIFGNIPSGLPRLGWNGFASRGNSDFFWRAAFGDSFDIPERDTEQRHEKAEKARERFRRKWKKNNPWSDPETFDIVPVGNRSVVPRGTTALATLNEKHKYDIVNTGRVTDPGYIDAEWSINDPSWWDKNRPSDPKPPSFFEQMRDAFYKSNSPRSLFKNLSGMTGAAGTIGKIGMWGMAFSLVISTLAWFGRSLKRAIDSVRNFGEVILQATESWRQLRESHFYGTSMGSLAGQWKAMTFLGGDAASASALWDRLSTDRAMLAYGGNGGRMMEAARLFGVGILGSGEYGYATNDEFMRNVAIEMSKSSKSRQKALANVLGLDPYQFWSVSNGVDYYDYVTNRRTLRGMLRESLYNDSDVGKEIFSEESVTAAREFEGAWGEFVVSLKELGGEIGEAILPLLNILLDTLNGIVQFISMILDPITKFLNWFFNLFSVRHWAEMDAINDTPTSAQISARTQAIGASGNEERNVIINMGDISLSNLGLGDDATPEEISDAVANRIFNRLGNHLINGRR